MLLSHLAYLGVMALLAASVSTSDLANASGTLVVIGAIGAWRYSWLAINVTRAAWFINIAYPRRKRRAKRAYRSQPMRAHAYFMVTTYRVEPDTTLRVYRSIFEAAARSEGGATIVASVVDGADVRLLHQMFARYAPAQGKVRFIVDQIPGTGKRDAMTRALRIIARLGPTHRDILAFVDGDSMVPEDLVDRSASFLLTDPEIGALTTDEAVEISEPGLFADWFELRFTQRQVMMSSVGLGNRVLTLTGRMSVFRADLATDPSFIDAVQSDHLDHWRLGRVNFLTGDDKSTWYWLMKNGYKLAFLPDVRSLSMETQPKPTFFESARVLMTRWFGNMLRTNGRALALRPSVIGRFTWMSILDQRLSIWTTLTGPISVILTALFVEAAIVPAYLAWVMGTRYVYCAVLSAFRRRWFPVTYPPLLYFSQIFGALVKSYVLFRLDRQKWTRQSGGAPVRLPRPLRLRSYGSAAMHMLSMAWLVIGVFILTGI